MHLVNLKDINPNLLFIRHYTFSIYCLKVNRFLCGSQLLECIQFCWTDTLTSTVKRRAHREGLELKWKCRHIIA